MARSRSDSVVPGGVDDYIAHCPIEAQDTLQKIRAAIREVAPDSTEAVSYFNMPGYGYEGYDYNGIFAWFSFKIPNVGLHLRPPAIGDHKNELRGFAATKAIVSFRGDDEIPAALVKKLVEASLKAMKDKSGG